MYLSYSVVNPLTKIEVVRRLPQLGEVLVESGIQVEPHQVVAESVEQPEFTIINVARLLSLPPRRTDKTLRVEIGDEVEEGQVLATRGGLGGRVIRTPFAGVVTGYGRGRMLIEAPPTVIQLKALVPGTVIGVEPGRGAVISTQGAFLQSAWGNGQEAYGVLKLIVRAAHHPLRPRRLDASVQGAIVVGGASLDDAVIDQAVDLQVRGIVVGGVPADLLPRLRSLDFPVVATEGVGKIPMSAAAFKLLKSLDGREAAVSGQLETHWTLVRPYIAIPMPAEAGEIADPETSLEIGSKVRALRPPYLGMIGVVTDLPATMTDLETGARVPGAYVEFEGETAFVPFPNLERIF